MNAKSFNENDDWDPYNFHTYGGGPTNITVDEDYGPDTIPTGVLDARGSPVKKPNPNLKQRIGFHLPSPIYPRCKKIIT